MGWRGPLSASTLAAGLVALAVAGAVAGTALGARTAAEAPLPGEAAERPSVLAEVPPAERPPVQRHSVTGRVGRIQATFIRVRRPNAAPVVVRVLPRTVIRRGGERVALDALAVGDRVTVVGRVNDNGVLLARNILVRPGSPPAAGSPEQPAGDESESSTP
jgi:hypothetical protein